MLNLDLLTSLYVGGASLATDVLWTLGIRRANQGKAGQSAFLGGLLTIVSGIIILEYVENKWYLIPAAIGGMLGNYMTVKLDSRVKSPLPSQTKVS